MRICPGKGLVLNLYFFVLWFFSVDIGNISILVVSLWVVLIGNILTYFFLRKLIIKFESLRFLLFEILKFGDMIGIGHIDDPWAIGCRSYGNWYWIVGRTVVIADIGHHNIRSIDILLRMALSDLGDGFYLIQLGSILGWFFWSEVGLVAGVAVLVELVVVPHHIAELMGRAILS